MRQKFQRLLRGEVAVCIESNPGIGVAGCDLQNPGNVIGQRLSGFGDLDLHGREFSKFAKDTFDLVWTNRRQGCIHANRCSV